MPGLKEVRNRIASVNSTKQITSAMKMVSAAKLRKAQTAIQKLRPYAGKLGELLSNLGSGADVAENMVFFRQRPVKNVLLVVITSNRGLCGAFNSNVIKSAVGLVNKTYLQEMQNDALKIITIGKRASDYFQRRNYPVMADYSSVFENLSFDNTAQLASLLMEYYANGSFDKIILVYNQFKNAATQILSSEVFLPVEPAALMTSGSQTQSDYIFEPERNELLIQLVPKSLKIKMYKAILDSWASEHGARMTAMQKASDNADDLLKNLQLTYNKARQASITGEIIEIVSGVNALKG